MHKMNNPKILSMIQATRPLKMWSIIWK